MGVNQTNPRADSRDVSVHPITKRPPKSGRLICGNQQRCLHFRLLLEDPFEQLSGIVKNVDRHGKPALFLIMTDRCLRIIQEKTKAVRRRKSVNNATISYSLFYWLVVWLILVPPIVVRVVVGGRDTDGVWEGRD